MPKVGNPDLASKIAGKVNEAKDKTLASPPVHMQHHAKEQRSIIRQVCIKSASEAVSRIRPAGYTISSLTKEIITLAEELENWITR
jgi:hypothetical protein